MSHQSCFRDLFRTAAAVAVFLGLFSASARADWQDDIGTFRIGVVAEPGAGNSVPGLSVLTKAYSMALGMKVEFLVAPDYATLIEAQTAGRVEYAIYSALAYAAAAERCDCIEPLAAPTDSDGAIGFRSILVTRDGKVPSLQAMGSHRIAVGAPGSIAGWLLPLAELASQLPSVPGEGQILEHAPSASAAETMLIEGKVDAVFGWSPSGEDNLEALTAGTVARLREAGVAEGSLQVVWKSGLLRYGPHAVMKTLDPEAKRRLGVFLTNLKQQTPETYDLLEPRHSGGFVAVKHSDYTVAAKLLGRISRNGDEGENDKPEP
ncbi:phosphate/phosphite/phosphonate ABC transporter substrate-binding protein [Mesorhizobium retamae]|uniref:PhnD/SsuA/transferrin family substrate-binding protein n=1 Tax=Mesorhizobium retamae TaxID=2912854 RepID=A0ABS9QG28_9HYPH|nr:PhnD/SsuA/transferrin family substrate-binding protein [Mesorhizobium sp. IRAMC:0171]MCG7506387.1 PhnD/SsuA/transferrin family substrate-binding protein [Mesorhizobium sp. IRAMC:0171]